MRRHLRDQFITSTAFQSAGAAGSKDGGGARDGPGVQGLLTMADALPNLAKALCGSPVLARANERGGTSTGVLGHPNGHYGLMTRHVRVSASGAVVLATPPASNAAMPTGQHGQQGRCQSG